VLSSQATVAGYKAVLVAASEQGKLLPMLTTAAGTLAPAKVFVIGAGVAGLQAIATARRLGAIVSAFDVGATGEGARRHRGSCAGHGRGHHHGADPGQGGTSADYRANGSVDVTGVCDRRPGRRDRR